MDYSLRQRLTVILISLVLVTWLIAVIITALISQKIIFQQVDRQLSHYMDVTQHVMRKVISNPDIRDFFRSESEFLTDSEYTRIAGYGEQGADIGVNIWYTYSRVLVGEKVPLFPAPEKEGVRFTRLEEEEGNPQWRILYRFDPATNLWLAVGVNMDHAENIGTMTLWRVLVPISVILPVFIVILLWGVGRGLKPLNTLAKNISDRSSHSLDPIDLEGVPSEIRAVVHSLNDLLQRLKRALDSEHRFTANAAHELQTPLAAIAIEVQHCQRLVDDHETRKMFRRIHERVRRSSETVSQLLTLARLDPDQDYQRSKIDLKSLLVDVIAEIGQVADEQGVEVALEVCDGPLEVLGNREWINILMRNLLLNAFRHSISPSVIEISLAKTGEEVSLIIANDCDSIDKVEFDKLVDRFYRPSKNYHHGVGLGLSIVERIAELHGARFLLGPWKEGGEGFKAEVIFH